MALYLIAPPIIACVLSFALAILVMLRDYRKSTYRLFTIFLAGAGLWGLIVFAFRVSPDTAHAKFWIQLLSPVNVLTCVVFLHFSTLHTRIKTPRWLLIFAYAVFVATVGLTAADKMVVSIAKDPYGFLPVYSTVHNISSVACYIFLILGSVNFVRAYRRSDSFEERNSYLYFMVGIFLSMVGGAWDYVSTIGVNVAPLGLIGNILFGLLATIAILKYHLLDIRIVMRKGVAYLIISTIVAMPYVGVIILFNIYFQENVPIWGHFILLFVLAFLLQFAWQRVQNLVDRWFYRERYDFLQELEKFSQEAHAVNNLSELGSSLVGLISRAFQTASVHLLLANESGNLRTVSLIGSSKQEITIYRRSLLIGWFARNSGVLLRQQLDLDPQLQSLTAREKADIDGVGTELFVPLKSNEGDLGGLLLMGPKRSEQPYSDEDLRRILTVTSRMSVELENARLYAQETAVRQELQRQNEQRTEFLHHVAHELKTPLTAVISSSELMTADSIVDISYEQRERLLNNINRSAWLMDKKVSELLDLARIQIGRVDMKIEPLNLHEVIDDLTSQLSSLFKNKEQSVETQIPDTLPLVRGDRERTTEVVLNLLSNANKFSPAGGHITIVASELPAMVQVEVKDSAPIIAEADRARIFDPYYRGGSVEDQRRVSGLGLGLAISKSLITLQRGEIGVTIEEGRGNTFYFTLPAWTDNETA